MCASKFAHIQNGDLSPASASAGALSTACGRKCVRMRVVKNNKRARAASKPI